MQKTCWAVGQHWVCWQSEAVLHKIRKRFFRICRKTGLEVKTESCNSSQMVGATTSSNKEKLFIAFKFIEFIQWVFMMTRKLGCIKYNGFVYSKPENCLVNPIWDNFLANPSSESRDSTTRHISEKRRRTTTKALLELCCYTTSWKDHIFIDY